VLRYPLILRLVLWLASILCPKSERYQTWADILRFTLDYPRRVYTNIFPSAHTWWLLFVLILLTSISWAAFSLFNKDNGALSVIPDSMRQAVGFFQSIATRSAGFSILPIPALAISSQVIILVMMYISAYPVMITLRSSNVYEERSLGIYQGDAPSEKDPEIQSKPGLIDATSKVGPRRRLFFLRQQLQYQLAHDLWWLALSTILIACIEASSYDSDPVTYSVFNIIFEVVSAYGPVGLSTGVPNAPYSLSGGFHKFSKLVICAVMIRDRHRGLPVAIDKAILLPGDKAPLAEVKMPDLPHGPADGEGEKTGIERSVGARAV
jgi:Trk-type K+ transport system membrane component